MSFVPAEICIMTGIGGSTRTAQRDGCLHGSAEGKRDTEVWEGMLWARTPYKDFCTSLFGEIETAFALGSARKNQ